MLNDPIGRNKWLLTELPCGIEDEMKSMTLSACNFPAQFTCDSGHCIDINKRCDEVKECFDGSDEQSCLLIDVPSSYNPANQPTSSIESNPLTISFQSKILSIDAIETSNMKVKLTMEISMQ